MKARYLLILLLIASGQLLAQSGKTEWTLQECIDYALKNNIDVRQSEVNVLTNTRNLQQAKFNRLPNLNANTQGSYRIGRSVDPFTNVIVDQDVTSQSYNASANVTVFNGLNLTYNIKQNQSDLDKSEYDLAAQKNNTALNIANLYLNILLAQEQLKSATLSLETSNLQVDRTQKQVDAGAVALQNLLQAKQQAASDEVNLITAENTLELAKLSLKQALQLPASDPMEIVVPEIDDPDPNQLQLDLDLIYQTALGSMPEIKSAESQVRSSYYGINIARTGRLPTLSFGLGVGTSYSSAAPDQLPKPNSDTQIISAPVGFVNVGGTDYTVYRNSAVPTEFTANTYFNQLDFNLNRGASLTLTIPIFSRFQNNTNVAIARLNHENAKYIETTTKNQLRQNIEQAYYNARAAAKTYVATRHQVEALQESFRNAEQRFNLGATNSVEYNQIKNDYNRAQNDMIRNKYDYIFKLKVLDFYQGKPIQL